MRNQKAITTIWTSFVASAFAGAWVWGMFYAHHFLSEPVHPGTVVSGLFIIVLGSATWWGTIPSLAGAITAAVFFATYFQPPIGQIAATPQGWVSTGSFVLASLLVSQLSMKARRSAAEATRHSRESEQVEQFGRGLLACTSSQLVASTAVNEAVSLFGASAAAFEFILEGGSYRSGPAGWQWSVPEQLRRVALAHSDWVRDPGSDAVVIPLVLEHTPVAYFGKTPGGHAPLNRRSRSRRQNISELKEEYIAHVATASESSGCYQQILGCQSGHGGPDYESCVGQLVTNRHSN